MDQDNVALGEAGKYERLWNYAVYRKNSPGERVLDKGAGALLSRGAKFGESLCDFGCGTGRAALGLAQRGLAVTGIDIAPNAPDKGPASRIQFVVACLWDLPEGLGPFDWGYCTDVMEHIPPEKVQATLSEICRSVRRSVFFQINKNESHGGHGELVGVKSLHLSCYPAQTWRDFLNAAGFSNVELLSDDPRECCFIADGRG